MKDKPALFLYSASPRRAALLESAGMNFEVYSVDTDESIEPGISPEHAVFTLAERKLKAGLNADNSHSGYWGLAADTMVEGPRGLLGKPGDIREAESMLESLSGLVHKVHTGIAVYSPLLPEGENISTLVHSTLVEFRNLSSRDIADYLKSGEWEGVAGAYRIQQQGAFLIKNINGLWSTVVGLPLSPLYGILTAMSYPFG
jgi:septum formation protein